MNPKVFISYSWDDDSHKEWVKAFATRLRSNGVDATLDHWDLHHGDRLPQYMEKSIRENEFVLIVCTPEYKRRSDDRSGGAGYEGNVMTGELLSTENERKFIPVLRAGDKKTGIPTWLGGKYFADLRGDPFSETNYQDMLDTLLGRREKPPVLGTAPPKKSATPPSTTVAPAPAKTGVTISRLIEIMNSPVAILEIVKDEIGTPRNDGTRGSVLYAVPFRLNRAPSGTWIAYFLDAWRSPPQYTSMHRPNIAEVRGDRIVLDGTTLEEVRDAHKQTLLLCIEQANRMEAEFKERRSLAEQKEKAVRDSHQEQAKKLADDIKF